MEKIYGEKGIILPEKIEIPEISDERLLAFYKFLKPLVTIRQLKYLLKKYTVHEMRCNSYTWDKEDDKRQTIDSSKLETVEDFLCFHSYCYYGFFKPSICEVLSQTPSKSLREADFFEIIEKPETREDVFRYKEVVDKGFHLSKVRTYKIHK